jgi:hypothetical protein
MSGTSSARRLDPHAGTQRSEETELRLVGDADRGHAELERQHYLLMIETMVRDGWSEGEITGAVEAARVDS